MFKKIASVLLRNRNGILIGTIIGVIALLSIVLVKGVSFTTTQAQLLPDDDQVMINFRDFQHHFGKEDNVLIIGYDDPAMQQGNNFQQWNNLLDEIRKLPGIEGIFSMTQAKKLERDTIAGGFVLTPIIPESDHTHWRALRDSLHHYPFYESLLYNQDNDAMQVVIYMNPKIMDSQERIREVLHINDLVNKYSEQTGIPLYLSGMPVIRTMNSEQVKGETILFISASLLVTSIIFFLFFRSFRATLVAISVVLSAVIVCFALLSILDYDITILTALVPPLVVVIGIPNCIYMLNKYQLEYKKHQNKIKALQRMIIQIGNAAILTNLTTAFGFFTFVFTDSSTLQEFGIIASLSIVGVFILSFLILPAVYSYMPPPKERHLKHHRKNLINTILHSMEDWVFNHRKFVYIITASILLISITGIFFIQKSGNLLDDMSKKAKFYEDIQFFDEQFGGVLPLEIMVNSNQAQGISSINSLERMDRMSEYIDSLDISSKTLSIAELVKFAKQGYYGNDPEFYNLPTNQERPFILNEIRQSQGEGNLLKSYVDSTLSRARMTTMIENMESSQMESVISDIQTRLTEIFPPERYETYVTGMAFVFMKGTDYLTTNLFISLSLAIFMIAVFMAIMFRSVQMIFIAIIPNFLPLLATAGLMGYLGVALKPSTILVFSIAFGIAVDDTIHFLAKYRQELKKNRGNIALAVKNSIDEVGSSMFYTSVVLFAGFAIFLFSGFMGIVALGGLVAFTLFIAMLSNLIVLPSLLMSYEKLTTKEFIEPDTDMFDEDVESEDLEDLSSLS
ncbi:MAG: MMPL family transporter [Weeksellaceae bacterium]|nr:MMPL family transporter [Weeksellaceae bacterium]